MIGSHFLHRHHLSHSYIGPGSYSHASYTIEYHIYYCGFLTFRS